MNTFIVCNLNVENLIQGHGKCIFGKQHIQKEINDRLFYLNKLKKSDSNILLEDCLPEDTRPFSGADFHKKNCLQINQKLSQT